MDLPSQTTTTSTASVLDLTLRHRRLTLTLRRADADIIDRAAARSGCTVNIWLRGLIEARMADERAIERDLLRIANALDLKPEPRTCSRDR